MILQSKQETDDSNLFPKMKNSVTKILFPLLFLSLVTNLPSFAQQSSDHLYMKVDYFRATGPQMADYLEVEQEIWKPMHQERFNRGIILSWDFYAVFAGDQADDYSYIAVNVFDDFDKIDYYDLSSIASEVYPDMDLGALMRSGPQMAGYLEGDEEMLSPMHRERFSRGIILRWDVYAVFAGDQADDYIYIAVNVFDDFDKIDYYDLRSIASEVYPDMDLGALMERTRASREVVRTEIWKVNKRLFKEGLTSPQGAYATARLYKNKKIGRASW